MTTQQLQTIPFDKLIESPWNPRKRFDKTAQETMTASMQTHGQFVPGVVRPIGGKFEIGAGHRRSRSAKLAGLPGFLAIVRPMDDSAFCELLAIENDEREDVHPLEQADGFKLLMERSGYDVAMIARRVNRSHEFVHDRMRLLNLIPELKTQFLENRFLLSHAIILARLAPQNQKRAMDTGPVNRYEGGRDAGGLYREDTTLDEKAFGYVPRSPGELQEWVNNHCRFKPDAVQLEEDLPETAVLLEAAEETGTKIVYITDNYMVSSGARDVNEKTIGKDHWTRADGLEGSKECDRAVVGIFADGDRRGTGIGVCVSKTSCEVHWKSNVLAHRARAADRKKRATNAPAKSSKIAATVAPKIDKTSIARAKAESARNLQLTKLIAKKEIDALEDAFAKAPDNAFGADGLIGKELVRGISAGAYDPFQAKNPPKSGNATAIVKWLVRVAMLDKNGDGNFDDGDQDHMFTAFAIDVKALRAAAEKDIPAVPVPDGVKAAPTKQPKASKSKGGVTVIDEDDDDFEGED